LSIQKSPPRNGETATVVLGHRRRFIGFGIEVAGQVKLDDGISCASRLAVGRLILNAEIARPLAL